jgi:hypothetical protein
MKKNIQIAVLGLALMLIGLGCDSLKDTYGEFILEGEKTYIGAPDSVLVGHGFNKLRFWVIINADPKISSGLISTSDGSITHEFDVSRQHSGTDTVVVDLSVPEGEYTFGVFLMDDKGNKSVRREIGSRVYGENYQNQLVNRSILSIANGPAVAVIQWEEPGTGVMGTLLNYETNDGELKNVEVPNTDSETVIENYKRGGLIKVSSYFEPTPMTIELFEGIPSESSFPLEYQVDKSAIIPLKLPGDAGEGCHGSSYARLFDGKVGEFWHSCGGNPDDEYPFVMSFDIGTAADISRFRLDERNNCCGGRSPGAFQLWGTNSLEGAETINITENGLEAWEADAGAKGWVKLLEITDNSSPTFELDVPGDGNAYRYVRLVAIQAINGELEANFNELTFWAK